MRRRWIVVTSVFAAAGLGAFWCYLYDLSQADVIARGVSVAGVDVGGLRAAEASARLRERLVAPLEQPIRLVHGGRRFVVQPRALGIHADVEGMVATAVRVSRRGNLLRRLERDVRRTPTHADVRLRAAYSRTAVGRVVARVARAVAVAPRSADVVASSTSIARRPSKNGLALRGALLRRELAARLLNPHRADALPVPTRVVKPPVTTAELPRKFPYFITISRSRFELRLWERLRVTKIYRIAVGQAGLETPAGLYHIQDKQVNPSWHVPQSAWAGELAGRVIPPGPDDPLKARWMGIYNGAGIHGTDNIGSLGSAASHGCIRMAVPDVIQLYDIVPLNTPVYIS